MVDKAAIIAALLSTTAISLAPNIILFLSPNFTSSHQNKSNPLLKIGQALAAGALIGDVFLHTLPHMMVDSCSGGHGHDVAETLGLSILFGFCAFFAFDCLVRAFGEEDTHHHTHGAHGSAADKSGTKIFSPTVILNLASDAMHNFTDGLAIGASFAVSTMALQNDHDHDHHDHDHQDDSSIHYDNHHDDCCKKTLMKNVITLLKSRGGLATLAIFCHEIPHELGDFAVLVSAGMSKRQAIMAQFSTAIAAFCGTIVGLLMVQHVQEFIGFDILVPITAGGFLYVAAVGILPSLLMEDDDHHHDSKDEKDKKKKKRMDKLYQLMAFMVGIAFMYMVALLEEHDHSHGEGGGGHSHGHHHHAQVVDTLVDTHDHHGHHDHHDHHDQEPCCDHHDHHDHDHHHEL